MPEKALASVICTALHAENFRVFFQGRRTKQRAEQKYYLSTVPTDTKGRERQLGTQSKSTTFYCTYTRIIIY